MIKTPILQWYREENDDIFKTNEIQSELTISSYYKQLDAIYQKYKHKGKNNLEVLEQLLDIKTTYKEKIRQEYAKSLERNLNEVWENQHS